LDTGTLKSNELILMCGNFERFESSNIDLQFFLIKELIYEYILVGKKASLRGGGLGSRPNVHKI